MFTRCFTIADWSWTRQWFRDETLNAALGPVEAEWLHAVLTDTHGVQLVVEEDERPVGLVGIVWAPAGDRHVVTDIAIAPPLRGTGLGRAVLSAATTWQGHPPSRGWAAFVEPVNLTARAFFESAHWVDEGVDGGMYRFVRRAPRARS